MTIYLVRHGESKSNYDNKHFRSYFCGRLDVAVNGYWHEKVRTIYVIILRKRNR